MEYAKLNGFIRTIFFRNRLFLIGAAFFILSPCQIGFAQSESFQERFLYGMVTLESGTLNWVKGGSPGTPVIPGTLLMKGAVVETPNEKEADIRLGCGSLVRLSPGTRLKILPFSMELEKGAVLTRHIGSVLPMKIGGAAPLIISKDSVVDIERKDGKVIARVQTGGLKTPGLKEYLKPGECVLASGGKAQIIDRGPLPRSWENPIAFTSTEKISSQMAEQLPDEATPEQPAPEPVASTDPKPSGQVAQPTTSPTDSGGDIEAEDWMRKPREVPDEAR